MSQEKKKEFPVRELFSPPAVPRPTVRRMRQVAESLGLDFSDQQMAEITDSVDLMLKDYDEVYRMVEPKPPVKYPRTPGYRPSAEENPFSAWYMKTDIPGAQSGKLFGKTVAIKDNICVAAVPMMNGSKLIEGYIPEYDATVVTRTLDAGGRILGKAACEHFCVGGNSFTNDIGPVLNPCDPTRSTGGSSSGPAALVACGEVDLAIGGDQGGSIRIPASCCGIVGLKPTFGLVPCTGATSIDQKIDHQGPMARTVCDCALFLEVLAGGDGFDHRQKEDIAIPEYSKQLKSDLTGAKIGFVTEGFDKCTPEVQATVRETADLLRKGGATVSDVSIPMHKAGEAIYTPILREGGFSTMLERAGASLGSKGFHSTTLMDHQHRALKTAPSGLSIPMQLMYMFGQYMKEENNFHFYSRASNLVMTLTSAYDTALMEYDVLIMPTVPCTAPKLPSSTDSLPELLMRSSCMRGNTAQFNATGHPALSINAGFSDGLPVGMMIIGQKWHEQDVLNVAFGFEQLRDGLEKTSS